MQSQDKAPEETSGRFYLLSFLKKKLELHNQAPVVAPSRARLLGCLKKRKKKRPKPVSPPRINPNPPKIYPPHLNLTLNYQKFPPSSFTYQLPTEEPPLQPPFHSSLSTLFTPPTVFSVTTIRPDIIDQH